MLTRPDAAGMTTGSAPSAARRPMAVLAVLILLLIGLDAATAVPL